MLKQASVSQIRKNELSRAQGYLVIAMCFYPRGLNKETHDEYRADLAPDRQLFKEWKAYEERFGHNEAFQKSNYESRFRLNPEALDHLRELAEWSQKQDIYLICQCEVGQKCHREMLLLLAHKNFGAAVDLMHHSYPTFSQRLSEFRKTGPDKMS